MDNKVIDDLGGTTRLAERLDVIKQVTSRWRRYGISPLGRYKIKELAEQIGYELPQNFMNGGAKDGQNVKQENTQKKSPKGRKATRKKGER